MSAVNSELYSRALAQARNELETLRQEFEAIAKRKAQLEAFIANTEPLVPIRKATLEFPQNELPVFNIPPEPEPTPIWKSIVLSINGKGNRFTVKDAVQSLERIGRGIQSPNKHKIVRAVLKKKTMNFEEIETGVFRVKKTEKEDSHQEIAS